MAGLEEEKAVAAVLLLPEDDNSGGRKRRFFLRNGRIYTKVFVALNIYDFVDLKMDRAVQ